MRSCGFAPNGLVGIFAAAVRYCQSPIDAGVPAGSATLAFVLPVVPCFTYLPNTRQVRFGWWLEVGSARENSPIRTSTTFRLAASVALIMRERNLPIAGATP